MDIKSFNKIKIDKPFIVRYKYIKEYKSVNHIRVTENTKGYAFFDKDKLVAIINCEKKDDEIWIQALEIFKPYKRKGLSYDLLDFATDKLGAEYLSVRKTNTVAIHVYKERGFKTFKESDSMYFMMK